MNIDCKNIKILDTTFSGFMEIKGHTSVSINFYHTSVFCCAFNRMKLIENLKTVSEVDFLRVGFTVQFILILFHFYHFIVGYYYYLN